MINTIRVVNLRNSEFLQFLEDFLDMVKQNDPALLKVQKQYDSLLAIFFTIEALFKTATGNVISDELEELDRRRDNAFLGIKGIINANNFSTNAGLKASAALLDNHLAIYGSNIVHDNYQSESAKLKSILSDWNTNPNLTTAAQNLGLQAWIAELADANTLFIQQYRTRAAEMGSASTDTSNTTKAVRLQANDAYYLLRDNLNAHFTINEGADPFGKTVSSINGIIDNYNSLLHRRSGTGDEPIVPVAAPAA